jgi:NADPH-dependent glutamate synthase beta subunit-like oxidoreductase
MVTSSILILFGLGFTAAAILAAASKILYVKEDPRVAAVEACFPGANCGGCGYPGCNAAAAAVVAGDEPPEVCVAGSMEIAEEVAKVMGMSVEYREPKVAGLMCTGGERADLMYHYEGVRDCRAEAMMYGGEKSCGLGCLGLGTCVRACPFDAIRLGDDKLPIVNPVLCRSCGLCADVCPTGAITIQGMTAELLHFNKLIDCLAPCMQKCPGQINVRDYIQQMKNGDMQGALLTIKERNPFPLAVGRICPAPCETICRRNIVDEGVAIHTLLRHVGDWEMNSGSRVPVPCSPDTGRKVAIIGGGPTGLTCAYFLRRLGHAPVIFEREEILGGMLRHAIPDFRLPSKVIDWEIQGILELGIEARTGQELGKDFTVESLNEEGFEAVFLATGAWKTPDLTIPGHDAANVIGSVDFLTGVETRYSDLSGKKVVVVGDTNTATDVIRSVVRLNARKVTALVPCIQRKMSANKDEIERAKELGTEMLFLTEPTEIVANESGAVSQVKFQELQYKDPKKATGKPMPVEGTESVIPADLVIVATDRQVDLAPVSDLDLKTTKTGTLDGNEDTLQTAVPHVFVGGEAHRGRSMAIQCVSDGRRAARAIHYYMTRGEIPAFVNPQKRVIPESILKNMQVQLTIPRIDVPEIPVEDRKSTFHEEVQGFTTHRDARKEASRCLRCGLTCYDADAGAEFAADEDVVSKTGTE